MSRCGATAVLLLTLLASGCGSDDGGMPSKLNSQRRVFDVEDLARLCAADLDIALHPATVNDAAQQKLLYWLGRAWDAGRAGVARATDRPASRDE